MTANAATMPTGRNVSQQDEKTFLTAVERLTRCLRLDAVIERDWQDEQDTCDEHHLECVIEFHRIQHTIFRSKGSTDVHWSPFRNPSNRRA